MGSTNTCHSGAMVFSCQASASAYDGKPHRLSGREAESERIRAVRGICETRVRYSYVCQGYSRLVSTFIWLVGTPATRR